MNTTTPQLPKLVVVAFSRGSTGMYDYFVRPGDDPKPGDMVLTSPDAGNSNFDVKLSKIGIGWITEVKDHYPTTKANKYYLKLISAEALERAGR